MNAPLLYDSSLHRPTVELCIDVLRGNALAGATGEMLKQRDADISILQTLTPPRSVGWDTARIKTAIESKLNGVWSWLATLDGNEEAAAQMARIDAALRNLAEIPSDQPKVEIPAIEQAFRAGHAAAEEALGAHGSDRLLDSIERAWSDYVADNGLSNQADPCDVPPPGWRCTRVKGHDGPCAAIAAAPATDRVAELEAARQPVEAWGDRECSGCTMPRRDCECN